MNKFNRIHIFGLILLVCITLVAGFWLALDASQAQSEAPLAALALQPQDVSQGALWKGAGPVDPTDVSQPLNSLQVENLSGSLLQDATSLLKYEEAYKVGAVELDEGGSGSVFVGNYLYRYPDQKQAQAAAEAFVAASTRVDRAELLVDPDQAKNGEFADQRIKLSGSEGTVIFWFVGVDGRTLSLLFAEGLPSSGTQGVFDGLVERVLSHQEP